MTGRHSAGDLAAPTGSLLDDLTAIVSRAAGVIQAVRPAASARLKADDSPVTDADEAAEAVILDGLARVLPGVAVVAEEACAREATLTVGDQFILVDPLDGTREFIAGRDEFTVNVAIVSDGVPTVGLIAAPALGRIWRGVVGRGGERLDLAPGLSPREARDVTPLKPRRPPRRGMVAAVSRSHPDPHTAAFVASLPAAEQLTCGSSLKFCVLAEGHADVYPRLAPTCEWDIAAGHAVVVAAGGTMTAPDGTPLVYGRAPEGFRVPGFIAWADAATPRLLQAIRERGS